MSFDATNTFTPQTKPQEVSRFTFFDRKNPEKTHTIRVLFQQLDGILHCWLHADSDEGFSLYPPNSEVKLQFRDFFNSQNLQILNPNIALHWRIFGVNKRPRVGQKCFVVGFSFSGIDKFVGNYIGSSRFITKRKIRLVKSSHVVLWVPFSTLIQATVGRL